MCYYQPLYLALSICQLNEAIANNQFRQGDYALKAVRGKDAQLRSTVEHLNALAQTMQADLLGFFDTSQIKQVLCHLINNAQEACTPSPEVKLNITPDADKLVFSVTDTGPGFSNLNEAAEAFYTTKADGNGIGLMLSRIITENHGGQLKLGNNPSGGATINFSVERGGS